MREAIGGGEGAAAVIGLPEGAAAQWLAALQAELSRPVLFVTATDSGAWRACEEMAGYTAGGGAGYLPPRETLLSAQALAASTEVQAKRAGALIDFVTGKTPILAVSVQTLLQRMAPRSAFEAAIFDLIPGQRHPMEELLARLVRMGYERAALCESRGTFSMRGGILDLYQATGDPLRVEFFDDEVDSLRSFDPESQRSLEKLSQATVYPFSENPLTTDIMARAARALAAIGAQEEAELLRQGGAPKDAGGLIPACYKDAGNIADWFGAEAVYAFDDPVAIRNAAAGALEKHAHLAGDALERGEGHSYAADALLSLNRALAGVNPRRAVLFTPFMRQESFFEARAIVSPDVRSPAQYRQGTAGLREDVRAWRELGYGVLVYAGPHARRVAEELETHLTEALARAPVPGEFLVVGESLPRGMLYPGAKFALITERELFGQAAKAPAAQPRRKGPRLAFDELAIGDLVVHETHGIGRFSGVETLTVDGKTHDYLLLQYHGGDKLYLPTDQLDRLQKYSGGDESIPRLSRLGSGEWQKTVARAREGVKRLAFDLVALYGERSAQKGFAFSRDNQWQVQMEERFPYEETPDQLTSIQEVKRDMESGRVMDRLLCGDVGYGKTEVAVRAAFKAAMDSKQVAFLVPTTILVQQHYNTFVSRFAGFPVNVELLSRFKPPRQQRETLRRVKEGRVDILIGTHKLLAEQVAFKDLGLLIIDEEQRFGVGHKEILKNLKKNVDVLTLTATPIPRTLHMSMIGIRDMSVIDTPPEQRFPVQTYVLEYSDGVLAEAVEKELARGGQAYVVYNKVRDMERYAAHLAQLLPEARIAFAHGQMAERQLEDTMIRFLAREYDVLLCSTIIESGMDIPNVNTIVVCNADALGLSQLYQLRGRVGRSDRIGYAYFTFARNRVLTEVAQKRLTSIREFTQFGAGFKIALRDLEIRGAGNLLGPEQSGHMAAVGYDLYAKLMNQAVRELRGEATAPEFDTTVDVPADAHIPPGYIPAQAQRMQMYKRIAEISTIEQMYDVQEELEDRYGDIPESVQNLLDVALAKAAVRLVYGSRLQIRPGELRISFLPAAPLDGAKLLEACRKINSAQLIGGETPGLSVRQNGAQVPDLLRNVPHIVHTILDCIEP